MKMWAIIQSCDYWSFKDGINPYHVYKTEKELREAEPYFSHAPYEIRPVYE